MTVKSLETIHNLEKLIDELYSAQKQYERQASNEWLINGVTKKYTKLKGKSEGIVEAVNWISQYIEYHNTETKKRKQILSSHPYPITQGKDGRYRSYVKTEGGKRRQIAKSTYEKVEDAIVDFYMGEAEEKSKDKADMICPLLISGANQHTSVFCKEEKCMWWRKYAGDCTISLMADMFADSDICRTIFDNKVGE